MDDTPQRKRRPKIGRLNSVAMVGREIASLYRRARLEEISTIDCLRLAQTLALVKACQEAGEIEARLEAIEEAVAARGHRPKLVS
jgi:hypothetical protein